MTPVGGQAGKGKIYGTELSWSRDPEDDDKIIITVRDLQKVPEIQIRLVLSRRERKVFSTLDKFYYFC